MNSILQRILLGIVVVIVLYFLYIYLFNNPNDKTIVKSHDARSQQVISASNLPSGGTTNYTYSIWLYINEWNYRFGESKVVFGRTDQNNDPAPSVKLAPSVNNLDVTLATYPTSGSSSDPTLHTCSVQDIPLQRWTNIILTLNDRALDIYLDGKLVRTCVLPGVPKLNPNSDLHLCPGGGFSGYISNFRYIANSVNPTEAYNIYKKGYSSGNAITGALNKYRVKFSFLKDNHEVNSFEL